MQNREANLPRVGAASLALGYSPPPKFRDALDYAHELVIAETGSDDFGSTDYLAELRVLLQSMDYDPRFSNGGRATAWSIVVDVLRGRNAAVKSMKATPGFDTQPVLSPVVITGVPRTGTTALHRLLAVDPRFQGLQTRIADSHRRSPKRTGSARAHHRRGADLVCSARFRRHRNGADRQGVAGACRTDLS